MKSHIRSLAIPALVGLGLFAGLLREVYLAALFGTSRQVEIFRVAFGLPSILSESLAISFVSVLIPTLLVKDDPLSFRRAFWVTTFLAGFVLVVGVLTMPIQAQLLAPGIVGENRAALIIVGNLCWLMFFLSLLTFPLRAYMSVRNRVWPAASAALLRSGGFIFGLALLIYFGSHVEAKTAAWATVISGLVLVSVHLIAMKENGRLDLRSAVKSGPSVDGMGPLMTSLALVFAMQLLLAGGRLLDRIVASEMAVGTLAAIEYSYAFLMAAAAVIASSSNILLAPQLGKAFIEEGRIPSGYWKAIAAITGIGTLTGLIMAFTAVPIIQLVLQYGAFEAEDTVLTSRVLEWHAMFLGPLVLALMLTQVLILTGGRSWLLPIAAMKLAIKVIGIWVFLEIGWGLEGIAASLGVAEIGAAALLALVLRRRLHIPGSA